MSKNLTRKGLALGAIVALGSSLFAGAPAFAGTESAKITLAPKAGTSYTTLIGANFDLKNAIDPTIKSSGLENKTISKLKFLVSNPSAQNVTVDILGVTNAVWGDSVTVVSADTAADVSGSATADNVKSKKKFIVVGADTATQSVDTSDIGAGYNTLRLTTSTDSTDAFSVTVQAFIDDNSDGLIGDFELTSPIRTVNFVKASSVTTTTSVSSAALSSTTLQGTIVLGNDVNQANLVSTSALSSPQVQIKFFKDTVVRKIKQGSSSLDSVDVQWDSTNSYLTNSASYDAGDALTAGTYTAKAYFIDAAGNYILLGAESAAVVSSNGTNASADNTDYLVATPNNNVIRASATTTTVRTGTTSAVVFTSRVLEGDNADNTAPWATADAVEMVKVAGLKVKVTLTKGGTFTAGHEVTAGGKTLTSTSGAVSYETTTDADGKVSVSATSNKGTSGDIYTVKVQVLTTTGWESTGDTTTVTFTDASISKLIVTNVRGASAALQVAKGGTLPLNFEARDNFGALSSVAGTYRVEVSKAGTYVGSQALSGGKATYTFTDDTISSTGNYVITAALKKLNTAGDSYSTTSASSAAFSVYVGTAAASEVSVPSNATAGIALEGADFVNHDLRVDNVSKTSALIGLSSSVRFQVNGTVTSANGAVVPGAEVTISAKGLQFQAISDDATDAILATDSITVRANASGAYSVYAFSHTAGDVKIAVASGAAKNTVTAKWLYPSAGSDTSLLTVSGAASVKSGRSSTYVISLTDKWGNAVKKTGGEDISVIQSGAGYLNSVPTKVSAVDGKATLTLIAQPADAGLTTLTVTYAGATVDVVAKKDVLVGVSASIKKAATSSAVVKNANGLTVKVVRGTKSATKTATSDKYTVKVKGGSGTVSVYVNGIKVASK